MASAAKAEAKKAAREAASREAEAMAAEMVVCNAFNFEKVAEDAKWDGKGRLESTGPIGIDPPGATSRWNPTGPRC